MKKYTALVALALLMAAPRLAHAHSPNQPPFVFVDDIAAAYYPVTYASLPDFNLPQDYVEAPVLANQALKFKVDLTVLPILPEEIPYITFIWEMGDGIQHEGTEFEHKYQKTGPYLVHLKTADSRAPQDPAISLDIVLVNVLPKADYKLPRASISINGTQSATVTEPVKADFERRITLDGGKSEAGSLPIASYEWDLGNQQLAQGQKVTHDYNPIISTVNPVLKVTDGLGFYAHAIAQIENSSFSQEPITDSSLRSFEPEKERSRPLPFILGGAALAAIGTAAYFARKRKLAAAKSDNGSQG